MNLFKRAMSIRWKLVLVYFMLVFVATTIIGSFMLSQIESYYLSSMRDNLRNIAYEGGLMSTLEGYEDLSASKDEVQANIDAWIRSLQMDVFVIDPHFGIVATNTANVGKNALDILDRGVAAGALAGEAAESEGQIDLQGVSIPVLNMAFPIAGALESGEDAVRGALYLRADMSSAEDSIKRSRAIFFEAMLIALVVTVLLGYLIAGSITSPVEELTKTAERMSDGDFSGVIESRSNDEIGSLAGMLDLLRRELNSTISQISGEQAKLSAILSAMADGLIATDAEGRIIHANPAAAALLRYEAEELENMSFDEALAELTGELSFSNAMEKTEGGPIAESVSRGGFTYSLRYSRFEDGLILILQDITERQKLEDMQTDFVANVSHELKTPLTTIKTYTETLMDGAVDDKDMAENFLGIINDETDRMARLVRDLLKLSRLENRQERWNKKLQPIIPIVESAVRKVEMTAAQKGQHMNRLWNGGDELSLLCDRDAIEQVLLNILSNAIKYTPEGGRIDVDVYAVDKEVLISVSDTGIGIPEKDISRVFERFFRVDKARSRAMGGTGLGLSITKQIVEEHGGTIRLESKEGRGTRVSVLLPIPSEEGEGQAEGGQEAGSDQGENGTDAKAENEA